MTVDLDGCVTHLLRQIQFLKDYNQHRKKKDHNQREWIL
jgi:hypothetical protein